MPVLGCSSLEYRRPPVRIRVIALFSMGEGPGSVRGIAANPLGLGSMYPSERRCYLLSHSMEAENPESSSSKTNSNHFFLFASRSNRSNLSSSNVSLLSRGASSDRAYRSDLGRIQGQRVMKRCDPEASRVTHKGPMCMASESIYSSGFGGFPPSSPFPWCLPLGMFD